MPNNTIRSSLSLPGLPQMVRRCFASIPDPWSSGSIPLADPLMAGPTLSDWNTPPCCSATRTRTSRSGRVRRPAPPLRDRAGPRRHLVRGAPGRGRSRRFGPDLHRMNGPSLREARRRSNPEQRARRNVVDRALLRAAVRTRLLRYVRHNGGGKRRAGGPPPRSGPDS